MAGVSTATVSYVLSGRPNGKSGVSTTTTDRVNNAAKALNYRPNVNARSTRTGRTGIVQLALTVLDDPWVTATAQAVTLAARKQELTTVILGDADWQSSLDRIECDVAFLDTVHNTTEERDRIELLVSRGQRLVLFSDTLEPDGYDVIRSPAYPGCLLAMEHLLENHERIGCLATLGSIVGAPFRPTRYAAYLEALRSHGIEHNPELTVSYDGTPTGAVPAAFELLTRTPRPTAVFTNTDFAGIAVIQAATILGMRVPEDIAVIGAGNSPITARTIPTLSTVGPKDYFRSQADIIVSRAVEPEHPPHLWQFDWALHIGGSTDPDAVSTR